MKVLAKKIQIFLIVSTVIFISSFSSGFAEDIEIYNRTQTVPNVLFILDTSSSMSHVVNGKSRMQHVKDAMAAVMAGTYDTLNVGVMNLGYWEGSGPDFPIVDINANASALDSSIGSFTGNTSETVGEFLTRLTGAYRERGDTPTVDTYYEAMRYFRGDTVHRGKRRPGPWQDHHSWYANDQLYPKDSPAYPVPGPSPQANSYHRAAANPLTYTGGVYDPNIVRQGSDCSTNPFGAGAPPGPTPCVAANVYESTPYTSNCSRVDPVAATNQLQCPVSQVRDCNLWADPSLPQTAPPNECASWGNWYCPVPKVNVLVGEQQGYYRCHHKRYGDFASTPRYVSPINTACTENYIVMLTDGAPSRNSSDDDASNIIYNSTNAGANCMSLTGITNPAILDHGRCGPDIARFMLNNNQNPSQPGDTKVKTYTVGIQLPAGSDTLKYLDLIASEGGTGSSIDAQDPSTLVNDLQSIVNSITEKPRVIARAATSLDLSNLGSSRSEVYVPLFADKANQPVWPGNLKGYLVNASGALVDNSNPAIPVFIEEMIDTDNDGTPDTTVPSFNPLAKSFWSSTADGSNIDQGGVVALINPVARTLLTENSSNVLIDLDTGDSALNGDPALFGLPLSATATDVDKLISWINGYDSFDEDGDTNITEARSKFVGDALHSDPVVASYDTNTDGNVDKIVTYFMTNEGILHAIDSTSNATASEIFGFMPRDLLSNIDPIQKNVGGTGKIYGLDGPLVFFQEGGPTNIGGNKYLFFGMRRGGMNYYGLNVTDPSSPSLMWTIKGGSGDFAELGQSWSMPVVTNVKVGTNDTLALVFGGGYDADQDNVNTWVADDQGRAVYIVDAVTGAKIWSAGPDATPDVHDLELAMTNAVAGDISVIDLNNDTLVDRLYFGDVGGHVWRIDLQGDLNTVSNYSGYLLADLHDTTTVNNRRFFARPVAALTAQGKLAVTIGSGNRAHPLETGVTNRFYTIFDPNPTTVPSTTPSVITDSNLQDLTGFSAGFDYSSTTAGGWRVDLAASEKVFNESNILRGELFFTTYFPPTNTCSNIPDGAKLFVVNLDGEPTRDLDSTTTSTTDASVTIYTFGIVPPMVMHYGATGQVTGLFLPNDTDIYTSGSLEDKFWTNKP